MKIITLYNIKGGVGKTAAAVNLAYLASRDLGSTLLVDFDPQAAASFYFRIRPRKSLSAKKVLKGGNKIDSQIRGTDYENLDLLPADFSFRKLDVLMDRSDFKRSKFRKLFEPISDAYQLIFFDAPPNMTLLSEAICQATDLVLSPVIPTTLSVLTFEKLFNFFSKKNIPVKKLMAFFSMVEIRKNMHLETIERMRSSDYQILKSEIPYLADVEKMGIHREPVTRTLPNSRASRAYAALWQEIKSFI